MNVNMIWAVAALIQFIYACLTLFLGQGTNCIAVVYRYSKCGWPHASDHIQTALLCLLMAKAYKCDLKGV